MTTLAGEWFELQHKVVSVEDRIDAALDAAGIKFDHWTSDWYDDSIELFVCEPLSDAQQSALWEMGFFRAWTHPDETKVKEAERYYRKPSLQDDTNK